MASWKGNPTPMERGLTNNHRCEQLLTKTGMIPTDLVEVLRLCRFKGLMTFVMFLYHFPLGNYRDICQLSSRKETWKVNFLHVEGEEISSDDSCSWWFPNSMNGSVFSLGLTLPPTKEGGSFLMKVLMFVTSNTQMQHVCMTMKTTNQPKNPKQ